MKIYRVAYAAIRRKLVFCPFKFEEGLGCDTNDNREINRTKDKVSLYMHAGVAQK